jgi:lysyl oxidase
MRLVLSLAAALVCALAFTTSPLAKSRPTALLPDIDQAPVGCPGGWKGDPTTCTDWDVCMVADAASPNPGCVTSGDVKAVRLRFTTTEDNVGDGPLVIYGHRNSRAQKHMTVRQAYARSDGSLPQSYAAAQHAVANPKVNYLYYEPAPSHKHWHLQGFEHFQLRSLTGTAIASDRKNGLCLGDRYDIARKVPHAATDSNNALGRLHHGFAFNTGNKPSDYNCQHGRTAASNIREVREGISVGQGDDYTYGIDFQWLDITHVPSGRYVVVNQANASRAIVEKDYANDAASIVVSIQWPNGATDPPATITAPPDVELVASCPDSATCSPPAAGARAARPRAARIASGPALLCPLHDELGNGPVAR